MVSLEGDTRMDAPASGEWACRTCTFLNSVDSPRCATCDAMGPALWECETCTLANSCENWNCEACGSARRVVLSLPEARPVVSSRGCAPTAGPSQHAATNPAPQIFERASHSQDKPSSKSSADSYEALRKDKHERYIQMRRKMQEKETERLRIQRDIQENKRERAIRLGLDRQALQKNTEASPPKPAAKDRSPCPTNLEIAVRCENCRVVKGTFKRETPLAQVRQHVVSEMQKPERSIDAQEAPGPVASGGAGPSPLRPTRASFQGGTYHLQGHEEARRSRDIYEEQKRRILEEARKIREREWAAEQTTEAALRQECAEEVEEERPEINPAEFVLSDPVTRRVLGAEDMNKSLQELGLENKSRLILQRANVSGLSVAPPQTEDTEADMVHAAPPQQAEEDEATVLAREQMRRSAAEAAARRASGGGVQISDESLLEPHQEVAHDDRMEMEHDLLSTTERTEEMDLRALNAAEAAEKRLRSQVPTSQASAPGPATSRPKDREQTSPKLSPEEAEAALKAKRLEDLRRMIREKNEERKLLRIQLEAERRERAVRQEELRHRCEARRQSRDDVGAEGPSEQPLGDIVDLRIRRIDGGVTRRTFAADDTMRTVLVTVLADDGVDDIDEGGYSVLVPFPTQEFIGDTLDTTLTDADLFPRGTICLQNESTRGTLTTPQPHPSHHQQGTQAGASASAYAELPQGANGPVNMSYESLLQLESVPRGASQKDILSSLVWTKISPELRANTPLCAICRCEYALDEDAVQLECLHIYHADCIW
eukprot:CAMPEP_0198729394 /NCGR_PEP_ID=MMETSP1475-20131203/17756_1 /TAXON_ID= ORGANISM="Unidentified sp., Strain CCMP1999" /NCGR_SAMPLE_ID=MMETSP1475 /ASSEMBLY_ACC=CAM_ASM_001111 /LENGTH=772 /DNA_ID=CAMNT_0044492025 /DNA_START=74 /DNA_END=2389 /DNA_ORIENTATION=-